MPDSRLDVLAIGAHPDDVELGCGGTVALLAAAGRRVGLLHLTRGEMGTRGSPEERRREAERAASALGAAALEFLDCGDGAFRVGPEEEDALIAVIRRFRPELILAPSPSDRHPDHGRAHRLVAAGAYYAGLGKRQAAPAAAGRAGGGEPHRPAAVFSYMQHDTFAPSFVVDVTATWERKIAALDAYESQIYQPDRPGRERRPAGRDEPATKISSRELRLAVEGRARHFGMMIGAELGEPFWSPLPLAVADPLMLLPRGTR